MLDDSQPVAQQTTEAPQQAAPQVEAQPASSPSGGRLIDSLPEDLRGNSSLSKFNSVEDLAKSYSHLESKLGSMYSLPSDDSSAEKWKEFEERVTATGKFVKVPENEEGFRSFLMKAGLPEKPEGYKVDAPQEIVDVGMLEQFKPIAHKLGLTNSQLQALVHFDVERSNQQVQAINAMRQQGEAKLRQEYGADFDARITGAKAALKHYETKFPDAVQILKNGPLGNNPVVVDLLAQVGESLRERGVVQGVPNYGVTRSQARDQIEEIRSNLQHPAFNPLDPRHESEKDRLTKLYEIAYPDG